MDTVLAENSNGGLQLLDFGDCLNGDCLGYSWSLEDGTQKASNPAQQDDDVVKMLSPWTAEDLHHPLGSAVDFGQFRLRGHRCILAHQLKSVLCLSTRSGCNNE